MKKKHWLEEVLLNIQSGDPLKNNKAWDKLIVVSGRGYGSFDSVNDPILSTYVDRCNAQEKAEFLVELKRIIRHSKKLGLTLDSMNIITTFATMSGEINAIVATLARTYLLDWSGEKERHVLAYDLLSSIPGTNGPNLVFYKSLLLLQNKGWIPTSYSIYVCQALLELNPEKWFATLSRMMPGMNSSRNKVMRSRDKSVRSTWSFAEEGLLERLKAIQVTYPQ